MWALLDKSKYILMDLAAPESKIDTIIATLKNKFDAPANLTFNKIFVDRNNNAEQGIILANDAIINGIQFDLSNETIYGTTYGITIDNVVGESFSYAAVA